MERVLRAGNEKEESLAMLRDVMSTEMWTMLEEHTEPVARRELGNEPRLEYLEIRKQVYECQTWYHDVWDEELTYYPGHGVTTPVKAREYIDNVNYTAKNVHILADVIRRREEDKKYDLKKYLRTNLKLQS